MSKPTKLTQKRRTAYRKARGLDKHKKKTSSEDQALEKEVLDKNVNQRIDFTKR